MKKIQKMQQSYIIDANITQKDIDFVRVIAGESGVFNKEEIAIAGELVEDKLTGREDSYQFLFIRNDNKEIIAYTCYGRICLTDTSYDLYWIVVHPQYQRQGLACKLLAATEDSIENQGGTQLYAETSGTDAYIKARSFYLKSGFKEIARLPEFYRKGDDKIIFCKSLR